MTYIVNEACIRCKYTDCVEVCPVDCFYEGENMLVIHPDECICSKASLILKSALLHCQRSEIEAMPSRSLRRLT